MEKLFSNIQINHEKINSNIDLAKVSILTQACLSHLITKGVDRDEAYRFIQSQSFEIDDLDDYLTTLSKNFENVSIEELKSITNEILSEKTNENFEEKINSIV